MTENTDKETVGWFEGIDRGDLDAARDAIETADADVPEDWPARAVETGFADDEGDYYDSLHEATIHATREAVEEREMADDQQLKHSIRAMDDCRRIANELSERAVEWANSRRADAGSELAYVRRLAEEETGGERDAEAEAYGDGEAGVREPGDDWLGDAGPDDERLVSLARRVRDLDDEASDLRAHVERTAPEVAPNLSALAGPVLAARLIALAGDLETLARKPAGTVQVLGAEEALFAHLRGRAPSPKHGVIYVHEAVRGTHPAHRGSAARALAGKLAIAARVDHYSGERKPELDAELADRIERIQARDAP